MMSLNYFHKAIRSWLRPLALAILIYPASPALAQSTKDKLTELQTQVQQLLDQTQRLQSTVDSKFGLMQHLVEQSTDTVNQMNATVAAMQLKVNSQSDATSGKLDSVSGQVQALNDSLDELKSRIAKLDKQMQDMQSQMQNVQPGGGAGMASAVPAPPQGGQSPGTQTPGNDSATGGNLPQGPATSQAPPLQETYQSGLRDYNAAHYDTASAEFADVLHYYPHDDLAGNAQFYLGEVAYRQQKYKDAIKAYNAVLENFSGNPKAPAAQLRKGMALIQLNQKEAGTHELRSLIQRYPQTPEASQARSKLNGMGVRVTPR